MHTKYFKSILVAGVMVGGMGLAIASPAYAHYTTTQCDRDGDRCYVVRCDDDGDTCRTTSYFTGRDRHWGYDNRYDSGSASSWSGDYGYDRGGDGYYQNGWDNPSDSSRYRYGDDDDD